MKFPKWTVESSAKIKKQIRRLGEDQDALFAALQAELEVNGRAGEGWPKVGPIWQFGKNRNIIKVHLNSNRPIYVVMYEIFKNERRIQVLYVGTHEKAPYGR